MGVDKKNKKDEHLHSRWTGAGIILDLGARDVVPVLVVAHDRGEAHVTDAVGHERAALQGDDVVVGALANKEGAFARLAQKVFGLVL